MSYPQLNEIYDDHVNLADGGLGLVLEDKFDLQIAHTPLWSTRAVLDSDNKAQGPQALLQAHLEFLSAGARTLLTSTYQASFSTFEREGYDRKRALELMSSAVAIADKARSQYSYENTTVQSQNIRIVLSLGPFGSTVSPMQDYGGIYPPPYGPRAYTDNGENITSFGDDTIGKEKSIQTLAEFHAERVLAYAENDQTWDTIDAIGFETLTLAREVTAVRRAVTIVEDALRERKKRTKPWWITAVFPDGRCPETGVPKGDSIPAEEVATAMMRDEISDRRPLAKPDGVGINCTEVQFLPALVSAFVQAAQHAFGQEVKWPWLILKPNGTGGNAETWAMDMARNVANMRGIGWGGMIVGGCCKATPEFIHALHTRMS